MKALLLIRNILFCVHGDGRRGKQWSGAERCPAPGVSGGHACEDNQEGTVCHTLESCGGFWSLLRQAATVQGYVETVTLYSLFSLLICDFWELWREASDSHSVMKILLNYVFLFLVKNLNCNVFTGTFVLSF